MKIPTTPQRTASPLLSDSGCLLPLIHPPPSQQAYSNRRLAEGEPAAAGGGEDGSQRKGVPHVLVFDHSAASGLGRDKFQASWVSRYLLFADETADSEAGFWQNRLGSEVRQVAGRPGERLQAPRCMRHCSGWLRPPCMHMPPSTVLPEPWLVGLCCLQVEGRDVWWQDVVPSQPTECKVTWRAAEDPLFKVGLQ